MEKYKESAFELAGKNRLIEELKERIVDLEETVSRHSFSSSSSSNNDDDDHPDQQKPVSKTVETRLSGLEKNVGRVQKDLGGLMVIYDDLQVKIKFFDSCGIRTHAFPILHGAATVETGTQRLIQDALTFVPFSRGNK